MYFNAHGNINFIINNSCVINRPNETFNEEGIDILFESIFAQVKKKNLSKWVLIELLGEGALPTPSAMMALAQKYKMSSSLGCVKVDTVCSTTLQKQFLTQVAEQANIELSFYETEEEAFSANMKYLSNEKVE